MLNCFVTITSKCMSFTAESSGGEYKHGLTVGELAVHDHWQYATLGGSPRENVPAWTFLDNAILQKNATYSALKANTGVSGKYGTPNGDKHNNIQPYIVTYFWRRTA